MEQPLRESQLEAPGKDSDEGTMEKKKKKTSSRRLPSAKELVAHYEKQGMEREEASLKVIQDLQSALFRSITATRNKKEKTDSRLLRLEMKVDSKPGYPQSLGIGVASVAIWNGAVEIWNAVRRATSSSSSNL